MIQFEHVSKTFPGGVRAVDSLTLSVDEGETLVLLGTSGSGKTTAMKMVNRLIEPTGGTIRIDGTDIMDTDPIHLRRSIGYAIQSIGLFPHMSIGENISIVPRLMKQDPDHIRARVDRLLELVDLNPDDFRDRFPNQLSGGQRQRIGVARALAADPPIILMDEPFGALDPITREQLQNEFLDLESQLQKTVIFVTHDVFEAVRMGDRIAVLDAGRLQQVATPAELVDQPANAFVEQFLGRHRFQLSLLTRTLRSMAGEWIRPDAERRPDKVRLRLRASLIDALDLFKSSSSDAIPVYDGDDYHAMLSRRDLMRMVTHVIEQTGAEE